LISRNSGRSEPATAGTRPRGTAGTTLTGHP
jgi:hypothetical protein